MKKFFRSTPVYMHAYSVTQSCLTLCDFMDYGPPDSSVHGIFQARILEWVAICYSRGSSWPRGQTRISCVSCTDKWILYHSATWEANVNTGHIFFKYSLWEMETITIFNWWFILNFPPPNQQTWFFWIPILFSFLLLQENISLFLSKVKSQLMNCTCRSLFVPDATEYQLSLKSLTLYPQPASSHQHFYILKALLLWRKHFLKRK